MCCCALALIAPLLENGRADRAILELRIPPTGQDWRRIAVSKTCQCECRAALKKVPLATALPFHAVDRTDRRLSPSVVGPLQGCRKGDNQPTRQDIEKKLEERCDLVDALGELERPMVN